MPARGKCVFFDKIRGMKMSKEIISTDKAPAAIGPYVQAVKANGFLFTSGQIAIDPASQKIVEGDINVQARRVMDNLGAILENAGLSFDDVVKTTCFLKNIADFSAFNAVYGEYFKNTAPARSCVEVARLPKDVLVEVELVAVCKD
jgi:reactive intermediate/imine deaminase